VYKKAHVTSIVNYYPVKGIEGVLCAFIGGLVVAFDEIPKMQKDAFFVRLPAFLFLIFY
jgi:hypothetical protein